MLIRLLFALLMLLAPIAAKAHALEGQWALQIDDATIFIFQIDQADDGEWQGQWTRPESFASNGVVFARLIGSRQVVASAGIEFAGDIELTFDDPAPGAIPDIFRFRHLGDGRAQFTYIGTPLAPFPLIAVLPGTRLGPFQQGRVYDRDNAVTAAPTLPVSPPTLGTEAEARATEEPEAAGLGADFLDGL